MPVTPLHLGPGAVLKAVLGPRMSLTVFAFGQFTMDLEVLARIALGAPQLHGFTNTAWVQRCSWCHRCWLGGQAVRRFCTGGIHDSVRGRRDGCLLILSLGGRPHGSAEPWAYTLTCFSMPSCTRMPVLGLLSRRLILSWACCHMMISTGCVWGVCWSGTTDDQFSSDEQGLGGGSMGWHFDPRYLAGLG